MRIRNFFLMLIVITIFSCKGSFGQNYPATGQYIVNNTMNAFTGVWLWVNGNDTVLLNLSVKKIYFDVNGGFYWDRIVGWHLYKRSQTIIESSYQYSDITDQRTFQGGNENDSLTISGSLRDITRNKYGELNLTINNSVTPNQLVWKLENSEGIKLRTSPAQVPYDFNFTLPRNMTLIKQ